MALSVPGGAIRDGNTIMTGAGRVASGNVHRAPRQESMDLAAAVVVPPANERDLAGWATSAGPVRPGRLIRGALHTSAAPATPPAGADVLHLIDLRRPDEGSGPVPRWCQVHHWPLQDPEWSRSARRTPEFFVASALRLVDLAGGPVGAAVALLASGEPVYIGCRLGKDRTGLVVLLLGVLFGVPAADLVRDYLCTAQEYAAADDWVRGYARARGEDEAGVAARLRVPAEVPEGILTGLPTRADLLARLGLDERAVAAALHTMTAA